MAKNNYSSIVVSTRVRLARNLENFLFPARLTREQGFLVLKKVVDALGGKYAKIYTMSKLPELDAKVMQEKHLISPNLVENHEFGGVVLNEDESTSIMINEEDHIRMQCIFPGFELDKAYVSANEIDDLIGEKINYAFSDKYGYLTSCITNVGTGMRASVMMFLPALTINQKMEKLIVALKNLGLTVRGVFGEGSGADGYHYQISNTYSLGISEKEILISVENAVKRVTELERQERTALLLSNTSKLKDMVFRAYAVLCNCFTIDTSECMQLLAKVKMGLSLNILRFKDNLIIDKLFFQVMPASLCKIVGKTNMTEDELSIARAEYVSKILKPQRVM